MRLSRTIAYAVHAVLYLARSESGGPVPCSELAREGQMPERFLLQILRKLVTHGLLRSTRGVVGGYQLSRPAGEITLRDVVEVFDNPLQAALPEVPGMPLAARLRILQSLTELSETGRARLQSVTFAELVEIEAAAARRPPEAPSVDSVSFLQCSLGDGCAATR